MNAPKTGVNHYHKDGSMRFFRNDTGNSDAYYEPNSVGGPVEDPSVAEPPLKIDGDAARWNHREGNDDFQPASRPVPAVRRRAEAAALRQHRGGHGRRCPRLSVDRQLALFGQVDPDYAAGVARGAGSKGRRVISGLV